MKARMGIGCHDNCAIGKNINLTKKNSLKTHLVFKRTEKLLAAYDLRFQKGEPHHLLQRLPYLSTGCYCYFDGKTARQQHECLASLLSRLCLG